MPMLLKKIMLVLTLTFIVHIGAASGQDIQNIPESDGDKRIFYLGEVVVEGKAETITKVATVDSIDKEKIELTTSLNVSDALNTAPGVTISVGTKNEKNINIRGFSQRYISVFYDGIPISIPNDGYVDTGKLPTGNISKITITKGISSVLYGPNTMGGVVNIVSIKPENTFEGDFKIGISEHNMWNANVNLGSMVDKFYVTMNGGYLDSEGFGLPEDFDSTVNEDGGKRENSGIDQKSGSFKIGFLPTQGHEYAFGVNFVDSEWDFPPHATDDSPRYWRFTDWEKTTYYLIGDSEITDKLLLKTRFFRDEYYNVLDSYDDTTYTTQDEKSSWHSTYDDYSNGISAVIRTDYLKKNTISFSFHFKEDIHKEQDDYASTWERYETDTYSYGIEDDIKLAESIFVLLGASYDIHDPRYANGGALRDDEHAFNPQAGISWDAAEDMALHFSIGRKTRFPTLTELYSGLLGRNLPNHNLKEEKAVNYELGIDKYLPGNTNIGFTLFYSDIDDLIVKKQIAPKTDQYQNMGEARYKGLEFSFKSGYFRQHNAELHYTFLEAEDRSSDRTSDHLEDRPKHKLYISDLFKIYDRLSFFAKLEWNSKRYYEDYDTSQWMTLDSFTTVDAKAIGKITKFLNIEAGAKNIFDKEYEFASGYPREGRTFFVQLQGKF